MLKREKMLELENKERYCFILIGENWRRKKGSLIAKSLLLDFLKSKTPMVIILRKPPAHY